MQSSLGRKILINLIENFREKLYHHAVRKPSVTRFKRMLAAKLYNRSFSIICNNCLGGFIYQYAGLEYLSPTIGMYFHAPCYLSFVSNFEKYLDSKVHEVFFSKYDLANYKRKSMASPYPIGVLEDGLELHFLHYKSFDDAVLKWRSRAGRVNHDSLFFLFSERELCSVECIARFHDLPLKNKVVFTAGCYPDCSSAVTLSRYSGQSEVGGADEIVADAINSFDFIEWLNRG